MHNVNVMECKNACAMDSKCQMVKYNSKKERCWFCDQNNMRPAKQCKEKLDFYEKVMPSSNMEWTIQASECNLRPYEKYKVSSLEECQGICGRHSQCVLIGYSSRDKRCLLSNTVDIPAPKGPCDAIYSVYKKNFPVPIVEWIKHSGMCRSISAYVTIKTQSVGACKENCVDDEKCAMVKYHKQHDRCWLLSKNQFRPPSECDTKYDFYEKDACAKKDVCGNKKLCLNKGNIAKCVKKCPEGYSKKKNRCIDVDECKLSNKLCGKHGKCFNHYGGFSCECDKGYRNDRDKCIDINECAMKGKPVCGKNTRCRNYPGTYRCLCKDGYELVDGKCKDLDECVLEPNICEAHGGGTCQNTIGSYKCLCKHGFHIVDGKCQDIDECAASTVKCGPNARCLNTIGKYKCVCQQGYVKIGGKCRHRRTHKKQMDKQKEKANKLRELISDWKKQHENGSIRPQIASLLPIYGALMLAKYFYY